MSVKKYKITQKNITGNTIELPITFSEDVGFAGQADLIKSQFVNIEKEKSVNEIIDYEKVRFVPISTINQLITRIIYKVNFYDGNGFNDNTWNDIGFSYEDIYYNRNRFKKSFLRLVFYDSDNLLNQTPILSVTLFPQYKTSEMVNPSTEISFTREDPLKTPNGFSEGFYQYFYKDLVDLDSDYDLYMRASFLNASTGIERPLMMTNTIPNYGVDFNDKIHLKYTFRKNNNNYSYLINEDSDIVNYNSNNNEIIINLYESVAL